MDDSNSHKDNINHNSINLLIDILNREYKIGQFYEFEQMGGNGNVHGNVFGVVMDVEKKPLSNSELLYLTNPTWPPQTNTQISVKDPNENKWYTGTIVNTIWNSTAGVVKLDKQFTYKENSLQDYAEYGSGINHYLLLPSYHWKYADTEKFNNVQPSINNVVDTYVNKQPTLEIKNTGIGNNDNSLVTSEKINLIPNVVQPPKEIDLNNHKVTNNQYFMGTEKMNIIVDKADDINRKVLNNFQNFKTSMTEVTKDMLLDANNPYYRPLTRMNEIEFNEYKMETQLYDIKKPSLKTLSTKESNKLVEKLRLFEPIDNDDIKFIINKNISINSIINDPEDEINEGGKIIKQVIKMANKIFTDLQCRINLGYVYFTRKGGMVQDVVTKKLVPNLNYFAWQEGKPIDYNLLKYVIFQNDYQKTIKENILQKAEAETILGLEYIIAIQCKSEYVFWCLKRLLMIWYGDKELEPIIRKIKVLINHYRADPSQEYNKINGLLPMIAIYPKYGIENARLLISKLEYYFSLYMEDNFNRSYQEIFYVNSNPTYFLKKNNLIYYTNGSIDLKTYIQGSLSCNDKIKNDTFEVDMSKVISTQNIIISKETKEMK